MSPCRRYIDLSIGVYRVYIVLKYGQKTTIFDYKQVYMHYLNKLDLMKMFDTWPKYILEWVKYGSGTFLALKIP